MTSKLTALAVPSLVGLALAGASLTPAFATTSSQAAPRQMPVERIHVQPGGTLRPLPDVLPVDGYELTGRFGDTSGLWSSVHTGLDFAAPYGTPVRSITAGTVVSSGYDGAYGLKTVVRTDDGTLLWYCHQAATLVTTGERVAPGRRLGAVGTSGNTTGPHLHLEVHPRGGDAVDPEVVLRRWGLRP